MTTTAVRSIFAAAIAAALFLGISATAVEGPLLATRGEVALLAGGGPDRCIEAVPGRKLCRWTLVGTLIRPGASPAEDAGRLVCDFPDSEIDVRGRCQFHVAGGTSLPPVSAAPGRPLTGLAAAAGLSAARNAEGLSQLVGDVPENCRAGRNLQTCRWSLEPGTPAHGRLAALAGTPGPAELRCVLPLDGSGRTDDSCAVVRVD